MPPSSHLVYHLGDIMSAMDVTVIGLGSMGMGMAQTLVKAGHRVHGFDISEARVAMLRAAGGEAGTLPEALGKCDVAICVVLNADQTEAVLFGEDGCAARMKPGAVFVSCATVPPDFAKAMESRVKEAGLHYIDAPISGGAVGAETGTLSIMASGAPAAFDIAMPVLDAMSKAVYRLGDAAGAGSAMKAVNQLLAGVNLCAMGEALGFAASLGLDLGQVTEVITQSAGNSWMFENRAPHVVENDYAPRSMVNIWPKDLGIVSEIAGSNGASVPLTQAALAQFRKAAEAGDGHVDDAAVTRVFARAAGVKLPGEA